MFSFIPEVEGCCVHMMWKDESCHLVQVSVDKVLKLKFVWLSWENYTGTVLKMAFTVWCSITAGHPGPEAAKQPQIITLPPPCLTGGIRCCVIYLMSWNTTSKRFRDLRYLSTYASVQKAKPGFDKHVLQDVGKSPINKISLYAPHNLSTVMFTTPNRCHETFPSAGVTTKPEYPP